MTELQAQIEAAETYEKVLVASLFQEWVPRMIAAAHIRPGDRVLDVACGTGVLARGAADAAGANGSVTGVDPNPGMLAVAKRRSPQVEWREGKAESLPFADASFDAVVSQFGLMFFADRTHGIREMWRVLRSGRRLAVAVWDWIENIPAYAAEVAMLDQLWGRRAGDALRAPFVLGDKKLLATVFADAGIEQAAITTVQGKADFPNIIMMVECDLRGWLRIMDVALTEEQIQQTLREAEKVLSSFVNEEDRVVFPMSAHVVTATK